MSQYSFLEVVVGEEVSRRVPRQARSQKRYDDILETAANLLIEKGFESATTNEIAERAEISVGSLYQYFNNKEAIVTALTERYTEAMREVADGFAAAEVEGIAVAKAVDLLLDPLIEFHQKHPAMIPLWMGAERSEELRASMRLMDDEVMTRLVELVKSRVPGVHPTRARMVAVVAQSAVKSLVVLLARTSDATYNRRAIRETKAMLVAYVDALIAEKS